LIDADSVNPECSWLRAVPKLFQHDIQAWRYVDMFVRNFDEMPLFCRSPFVRKSLISGFF
jgi:hypothetical protein